ncbi:MAG: hypothetical protein QM702_24345 [Rubrivivax sp.]
MKLQNHRWALGALGLMLGAALPALAQEPPAEPAHVPAGVHLVPLAPQAEATSREAVLDEFRAARAAGTLTPDGEAGDTPLVLAARERANQAQAQRLASRPDVDTALQAAREAAVQMSGSEAIADADVYEMTGDDGELVGFLFVVDEAGD